MNISEYFIQSRRSGAMFGELLAPATLEKAYQIQKQNSADLGCIQGWKLGCTTSQARQLFATSSTCYGAIYEAGVMSAANDLALPELIASPMGEVEVCFRLSSAVTRLGEYDLKNTPVDTFIDTVMPSIELPWSVFPLPGAGLNVLVADSCAAGALITGEELPWEESKLALFNGSVVLRTDCAVLAEGRVENIVDGPLQALLDFLMLAQQHKLKLSTGQVVATGGCTPCVPLVSGKYLHVEFAKLGCFSFCLNSK